MIEIQLITPKMSIWQELITYAEGCSWKAGKTLAAAMKENRFKDWERVFAAKDGNRIAGYCTVSERDCCIANAPYTPYIGFVFVGEEFRGRRLSQRLIYKAIDYLKGLGFHDVYLVSDHENLYEKYGFSVIDTRMTPWGAKEKIYWQRIHVPKILNFGSLNIDYVYRMEHLIRGGETFAAEGMEQFCGGKGLNQSVALAKTGVSVFHAGNVGKDGEMLLDMLGSSGVSVKYVKVRDGVSGHAIIQVDKEGQNAIILYPGANAQVSINQITRVLSQFGRGDYLLLQNEINMVGCLMERAYKKGMKIIFNPSPIGPEIQNMPLQYVSLFIMNEIEGAELTQKTEPSEILDELLFRYPQAKIVLTLGEKGSWYADKRQRIEQPIYRVPVADTTAAGDTFTGYFVGAIAKGWEPKDALRVAAKASAIAVSRKGAAPSIPSWEEVQCFVF